MIITTHFGFAISLYNYILDAPPSSLMDSTPSKCENNGRIRNWDAFLGSQHFRGREACLNFKMGLRRLTSNSIT